MGQACDPVIFSAKDIVTLHCRVKKVPEKDLKKPIPMHPAEAPTKEVEKPTEEVKETPEEEPRGVIGTVADWVNPFSWWNWGKGLVYGEGEPAAETTKEETATTPTVDPSELAEYARILREDIEKRKEKKEEKPGRQRKKKTGGRRQRQ
jgi:hypothetical protein